MFSRKQFLTLEQILVPTKLNLQTLWDCWGNQMCLQILYSCCFCLESHFLLSPSKQVHIFFIILGPNIFTSKVNNSLGYHSVTIRIFTSLLQGHFYRNIPVCHFSWLLSVLLIWNCMCLLDSGEYYHCCQNSLALERPIGPCHKMLSQIKAQEL